MNRAVGLTLAGVLVLMATVIAGAARPAADPSKAKRTETILREVRVHVERFQLDQGRYPATLDELVRRRYLAAGVVDGWDRPLVYRAPGMRGPFDVVSLGGDGLPGGSGVDADLWSHAVP